MANILILYHFFPKRATIRDHLYSFKKYSSHRYFYLNVAFYGVPWYVKKIPWDLVIFHTVFLSLRWTRQLFIRDVRRIDFLKHSDVVKVALPQDEFFNMDLVCDFINEFNINHVFSVAPESQWPIIYRTVDFHKVKFHRVLTGYLDDSVIKKVEKIARAMPKGRQIDIGYRSHRVAFWLGSHGALKWLIADVFKEKASQRGLAKDISTQDKDTFFGDNWYRFLLRCKYQIGVEGGASILDWDGTYRKRTEEYLVAHPQANFEEVERACFPGADGSLRLFAISPRHLEACLTRTCQVLIEGDYSGVLIPGRHYIEVKRDFSNLDEVLNTISKDEVREELTTKAWQDIVKSGNFTYRSFVNCVLSNSLKQTPLRSHSHWSDTIIYYWMLLTDRLSWLVINSGIFRSLRLVRFLARVRNFILR